MMRFWNRLFGRRERPVIDRRTGEHWRKGDLALCLGSNWDGAWPHHPAAGEINMVGAVLDSVGSYQPIRAHFLVFVKYGAGYDARRFRKIIPNHEPAEAEFTALIRRPVRAPEKVKISSK